MYGYWSHCLYSCEVESFESYIKSNKPLPTSEFDKFYNVVEPLIPLNSKSSNANSRSIKNLSIQNIDIKSKEGSRLSTLSVPGLNFSENEKINRHKEELLSDNEEISEKNNRFSCPPSLEKSKALVSSASNISTTIKDLDELWTVNPYPPYAAEVKTLFI